MRYKAIGGQSKADSSQSKTISKQSKSLDTHLFAFDTNLTVLDANPAFSDNNLFCYFRQSTAFDTHSAVLPEAINSSDDSQSSDD